MKRNSRNEADIEGRAGDSSRSVRAAAASRDRCDVLTRLSAKMNGFPVVFSTVNHTQSDGPDGSELGSF